jgi:hypothetical protein
MYKTVGLVVGSLASALGLVALSSPAHAIVSCTGNSTFGSAAAGSGNNCGVLPVGATFELDVTQFFADLGSDPFDTTQFGVGIITSGTSQVSFTNVQAVVTGIAGTAFDSDPIAIWAQALQPLDPVIGGLGEPNPFGSALDSNGFVYSSSNIFAINDLARAVSFSFTQTGTGGFGSFKASPDEIGLAQVNRFLITGQLASVGTGDPLASNIISFAVGPAGIPASGTTFGGFFTAAVPGPLPIAGVGAAFAWSRRIRRKQKLGTAG